MLVSTELIQQSVERFKAGAKIRPEKKTAKNIEEKLVELIDKSIPEKVKKGNIVGDSSNLADRLQLIGTGLQSRLRLLLKGLSAKTIRFIAISLSSLPVQSRK